MKMSVQTISFVLVCLVLAFSVVQAFQADSIEKQVTAVAQGQGLPVDTSSVRIPSQVVAPQMVGGC